MDGCILPIRISIIKKKQHKTYLLIIIHDMLLYFGGIHPSDKIFHVSRKKQNKTFGKTIGKTVARQNRVCTLTL